jgi:hypothetical protein
MSDQDSPSVASAHPKSERTRAKSWLGIGVAVLAIAGVTLGVVLASRGGVDDAGANPSTSAPSEASPTPGTTTEVSSSPTSNAEVLTPETKAIVDRLEAIKDPTEFFKESPADRAIWCKAEIDQDLTTTANIWFKVTQNQLDILPEASSTNTPQEIVTIVNYKFRQAAVSHSYEPKFDFDLNKTRKAEACVYYDSTTDFAILADKVIAGAWQNGQTGLQVEGYANKGGYVAEDAIDQKAPSTYDGNWSQEIQVAPENNDVKEWRQYVQVPFMFNGQQMYTYDILDTANAKSLLDALNASK